MAPLFAEILRDEPRRQVGGAAGGAGDEAHRALRISGVGRVSNSGERESRRNRNAGDKIRSHFDRFRIRICRGIGVSGSTAPCWAGVRATFMTIASIV